MLKHMTVIGRLMNIIEFLNNDGGGCPGVMGRDVR